MVNVCPNTNLPSIINEDGKTTQQLIDEATTILIKDFSLGLVSLEEKKLKHNIHIQTNFLMNIY